MSRTRNADRVCGMEIWASCLISCEAGAGHTCWMKPHLCLISPTGATIWQRPDRAQQGSTNFLLERDCRKLIVQGDCPITHLWLLSLGSVFYELAYSLPYNPQAWCEASITMVSVNQAFQLFGMHYLRVPTHLWKWQSLGPGAACDTSAEVPSEPRTKQDPVCL